MICRAGSNEKMKQQKQCLQALQRACIWQWQQPGDPSVHATFTTNTTVVQQQYPPILPPKLHRVPPPAPFEERRQLPRGSAPRQRAAAVRGGRPCQHNERNKQQDHRQAASLEEGVLRPDVEQEPLLRFQRLLLLPAIPVARPVLCKPAKGEGGRGGEAQACSFSEGGLSEPASRTPATPDVFLACAAKPPYSLLRIPGVFKF